MSLERPGVEIEINDWSAGFLDTPEPDQLPRGASPDARNGELRSISLSPRRAILAKRRGERLITPVPMTAAKVDGLFEVRRIGATPELVAVAAGQVYTFDGVDEWTQVGATTPFTAGRAARVCLFKNKAFLYDGSAIRRYDGTTLDAAGFAAPTGVTAMTATGTGLTGTYEACYVWYDQNADHESSPSAVTATLALTNEGRRHTKPSGSPPSRVTHWRAYVRRVDTNEFSYFRAATVPIATSTADEALADDVRVDPAPKVGVNDAPPAFDVLIEHNGWGLGIKADDDALYISKRGDLESWNPRDVFTGLLRGGGEPLRSAHTYGADVLVQKPHQTWRVLIGDQLPIQVEPLHSAYGNVSQEAALEVNGAFYAWDRVKGPYRTDTIDWQPLADYRIREIVRTVSQAALGDIRSVHDEANSLILWAVPVVPQTRKRVILAYHYGLDAWLPPWTGLEYSALASFTASDGSIGVYCGDYRGRLYKLLDGTTSGVPAESGSTLRAMVSSATSTTVTVSGGAFYATGAGLAGLLVAVRSPAGVWQWRRILSNTATTITLDTTNDVPWTTIPDTTYEVIVGGIEWYHWIAAENFGDPFHQKLLGLLTLDGRSTAGGTQVEIAGRFDEDSTDLAPTAHVLPLGSSPSLWGVMRWGVDVWGGARRKATKVRIDRTCLVAQFRLANYYPAQPVEITSLGLNADLLPRRRTES